MKKLFTVLFIALLFVSCSNDDNDDSDATPTPLEGKWTLTNASCFCEFGNNPDFSVHQLVFEVKNLIVINSGEFRFLINAECIFNLKSNLITFENGEQYIYEIKSDALSLTFVDDPQIADDELVLNYQQG